MPMHLIATEGPLKGLVLNLEDGTEWVIGRDSETADFPLEDATVSRKHARLKKTENGLELQNLSKVNPALINGEEFLGTKPLNLNDRIQIGNTIFTYSDEEIPENAISPKKKAKKKKKANYDDIFSDLEPVEEESKDPLKEEGTTVESTNIDLTPPDETFIESDSLNIPPAPPKPELTAYDTIFEDVGEDEEIPFNLIPESPLTLKVIAGPNAGAEISLEKGRSYIIGKDPNTADIVFQDLSVSRNHAKLNISADGVIDIEDLGSKNGVAINGVQVQEREAITVQDLIALGTTVFMIIDREAPLETIYSPVIAVHEPPKEEMPVAVFEEVPSAVKKDWKKEPIPTKHLILAGSIAAVFLAMFLGFFSLFKSAPIEIVKVDNAKKIKEALSDYPAVQFSYNPGSGKIFIVGHVLTSVDYQELKYKLNQTNLITSVEDNIVIDEGVWKMMNEIISDTPLFRSVSIHSPEAGKFVATGYLETADDYSKFSEYLTLNFPYLDRLENNVVIEDSLQSQIFATIGEKNLGAVTFQLSNGNVILQGRYSEKSSKEFKELLSELNKIKGIASIKNFAVASQPNQVGIDISGQYKVTGSASYDGKGYSVVMNGKVYTLGDFVNGMKITEIEKRQIFLEKDGLKYKIDYVQ